MEISIHQRLVNLAHAGGKDPNQVRLHYVMERFLLRLSRSRHARNFVLKGGMFLSILGTPSSRPTMDIDLLGCRIKNTMERIGEIFKELAELVVVEDDGVRFLPESVETFPITKGAGYDGVRVECLACLGKIPVKLKVDVGFGDVLYPGPEHYLVASLIEDIPAAEVVCYPKESLIAEKFQAMAALGRLNTRMKDFYDIRFLSQQFDFDAFTLSEAIGRTFTHRRTDLDFARSLFTEEFVASRQVQWKAFVRRMKMAGLTEDFSEVMRDLNVFLLPVITGLKKGYSWKPQQGWGFHS